MQNQTLGRQFKLWTILLVVVPSLLVMVIYTVGQIKVSKQERLELISRQVHFQKRIIDYWMSERLDDIRRISKLDAFQKLDNRQMQHTLSLLQQDNENFHSLSFIDKDGFLKMSTLRTEIQHQSVMTQPYFQTALERKGYISDVVIEQNSGLPIIHFSYPIFDYTGKFQGLVLGSVKATTLGMLLQDNWFDETGEIYLVNREGMLLTEPRYANLLMNKGLIQDTAIMKLKITGDALRNIRLEETGTATWFNYRGQKVLGAYEYMPHHGWTLIGKINEEEVLIPIYNQLAMMAGTTIFLLFLIIPLGTLITNQIKRPLDWLIEQSNLITTEDYEMVDRYKHTGNIPSELGSLCETFVKMSQKTESTIGLLRKNEAILEQKVYERTAALSDINMILADEITKCQAANKALQDSRDDLVVSESRYKDLFNYMHNGCAYYKVLFDEEENPVDLEHVHVNHTYAKDVGSFSAQLIGKKITDIFPRIKAEKFNWLQVIIEVAISEEPISFTEYFESQGKWYSISAYSPAKGHVAIISQDVTKYVTLQKEVARMDRLNLIGNMAAGLAHEIRNPMTVVKGYLQYFKKKIPNSLYEQFDLVLSELARIETIITDFLAIAKTAPAEPEQQDLNKIINSIAPLLQTDVLKRGMNLEIKLSEDLPKLLLDEKEIKQLLLNLAMNGLNAMEQHGTLTIQTKCQDDTVVLCITDCGCGISKGLQTKIFDPFFTTRDEGTGLGLSICASIVASHNGTIEISSEGGKGTSFIITFQRNQLC